MSEFLLRFSSKNRQTSGVSLSHDFTTRFNNPLKLSYDMKHELTILKEITVAKKRLPKFQRTWSPFFSFVIL